LAIEATPELNDPGSVYPSRQPFGGAINKTNEGHMARIKTLLVAAALAVAPIASATFHITINDAKAFATMKSTMLMPGKTKAFPSAGEYRVCNEGGASVRMWSRNNMTNAPTNSMLEPGQCMRCVGTMMSFENEGKVPVMLYAFGGLGGRPGRGPGHSS
jgi:hypothetical protein